MRYSGKNPPFLIFPYNPVPIKESSPTIFKYTHLLATEYPKENISHNPFALLTYGEKTGVINKEKK